MKKSHLINLHKDMCFNPLRNRVYNLFNFMSCKLYTNGLPLKLYIPLTHHLVKYSWIENLIKVINSLCHLTQGTYFNLNRQITRLMCHHYLLSSGIINWLHENRLFYADAIIDPIYFIHAIYFMLIPSLIADRKLILSF